MSEEHHEHEPEYVEVWRFFKFCLLILVSSALALGTITGLVWMTEFASGHKVSHKVLGIVGWVDGFVIASAAIGMGLAHFLAIVNRLILPVCKETWKAVGRQTNGAMSAKPRMAPMKPNRKGQR